MVRIRNIQKTILSYISSHRDDPDFSEADYILNESPLSPFLKLMKMEVDDVKNYMDSPTFAYVTYCAYVKLFLEPGNQLLSNYEALKIYQGSDYDTIGWYRKQIALIKNQVAYSLNVGPKAALMREEADKNIQSLMETGKTAGGIAIPGEKVIAYLKSADMRVMTYAQQHRESIMSDWAAYGWLRDIVSELLIENGPNAKLKLTQDIIYSIFGFTLKDVHKRAISLQNELLDTVYRLENFLLTKEHEELLMASDIIFRSSAVNVPEEIIKLAEKLEKIHAQVGISNESSGFQISIPDPDLLETDGIKELSSRHLCINAELYLGIGRYDVDAYPTKENRERWVKYREQNKEVPCAMSMKTGKLFRVRDLLMMRPIEKRGLDFGKIKHTCISSVNSSLNLIDDGTGTMVPSWCGDTVPLHTLEETHPAVVYLKERGFDYKKLGEQFDVSYCTKAAPEDRSKGRFYSRLINGMKNTPEGRIIIPVWVNGHRTGYQCRIIDKKVGNTYLVWDGSSYKPVVVAGKELYPPNEYYPKGFNPHKYLNALGSRRNELLLGYDQAVKWNKDKGFDKSSSFCILVEGPLDAAKIGPPAIALLGKSMSLTQAELIKEKFGKIIIVADNDKAGQECKQCIYKRLEPYPVDDVIVPEGKDAGELSYEAARELVKTSEFYKE